MDCDIFMRFRGGGIGHKLTWNWDEFLKKDQHIEKVKESIPQDENSSEEDDIMDKDKSDMGTAEGGEQEHEGEPGDSCYGHA